MTVSNVILILTAIGTALMAGLFYSYCCSVVIGLRMLPDPEYIAAMQAINRAIQNPIFFICFIGTPLLLPLSTYLNYSHPVPLKFWLLFAATILYLFGVLGITAFGNIPLNNTLEKFNLLNASKESIGIQRINFETRWNMLNIIRTISSILSLIVVMIACIYPGKTH